MLIEDLLLGAWRPPLPTRSKVHRMVGGNKSKSSTMFAKAQIVAVLTDQFKSNKQISDETGLQLNTVQQKTARLFAAGKIDRIMQKCKIDAKPICMYRKNK